MARVLFGLALTIVGVTFTFVAVGAGFGPNTSGWVCAFGGLFGIATIGLALVINR